jgi:hypothetical protein
LHFLPPPCAWVHMDVCRFAMRCGDNAETNATDEYHCKIDQIAR